MQEGLQTRFTIHQILRELKTSNLSFDEVFEKKIKNKGFSISDKRFIYTVVLNAMRNYIYIDKIISKFLKPFVSFLLFALTNQDNSKKIMTKIIIPVSIRFI